MKRSILFPLTAAFAFAANLAFAQVAPPPPPPAPPAPGFGGGGGLDVAPIPPGTDAPNHGGGFYELKAPASLKPQAFLGVVTAPVDSALSAQLGLGDGLGLVVQEVVPDSSAEKAGLQRHDVLKAINDQLLASPEQLATLVRHYGKDADVTLTVIRQGKEQQIATKLSERAMPERRPFPSGEDVLRHVPFLDNLRNMIPPKFDGSPEEIQKRVQEWTRDLERHGENVGERVEKMVEQLVERIGGNSQVRSFPHPPKHADHDDVPAVKTEKDQVRTTYNTANARVILKDDDGEIDVKSENGHRTLVAKNAKGETVFTGPINNEQQRSKVPELFRNKLTKIDVQTKIDVDLETH